MSDRKMSDDKLYDITQYTPVDERQNIADMLGVPLEQVHTFTTSEAEAVAAADTPKPIATMAVAISGIKQLREDIAEAMCEASDDERHSLLHLSVETIDGWLSTPDLPAPPTEEL